MLVILLLFLGSLVNCEDQVQKFTIHREEDCRDGGEVYTRNVRNLEALSPLVTSGAMKCFCNRYGVWTFSGRKNYLASHLIPIQSGLTSLQIPGRKCFTRKLNWRYVQLQSIRHVGSADPREPGLSLYRDPDLFGPELFLAGSRLSLPSPQPFSSFGFTGTRSWTAYEHTNYSGPGTCLRFQPSSKELIRHEPNVTLSLGSVVQGCPRTKVKTRLMSNVSSTSSLTLYTEAETFLTFDGTELRLPGPVLFIEFAITGPQRWTIYEGTGYSGKMRCLSRFGQFQPGQMRKYRFKREDEPDFGETWRIGSVRRGCFQVIPPNVDPEAPADEEEDGPDLDLDLGNRTDPNNGTVPGKHRPVLNRGPKPVLVDSENGSLRRPVGNLWELILLQIICKFAKYLIGIGTDSGS